MEDTLNKLKRFNLIMGFLHLVQGLTMVFLATRVIQTIAEFKPQITQFYLTYNQTASSLELTVGRQR